MTFPILVRRFLSLVALFILVSLPGAALAAAPGQDAAPSPAAQKVAGLPAAEALRLGEAMYRRGILPSGKPMTAIVQEDLELDGSMTTCASCHLRSGLGALEGGIFSPPTTGPKLYAPLRNNQDIPGSSMKRSMFKNARPAYTDESLAAMLRFGTASTGEQLSDTMPRYRLSDREMEILVYYLKNLSAHYSPGVTDEELCFATVVTEGVSPKEREAMLLPLTAYLDQEWNARISALAGRQSSLITGAASPAKNPYRRITLEVWELKGAPETWEQQLDVLYRKKPVFALVGGISHLSWQPVHRFCEKNQIPCILPVTELPVVSGTDWYTLYFSKGYYQEGEAAAKYLSRVFVLPPDQQVVQVYREGAEGKALARGFADIWKELGSAPLVDAPLPSGKLGAEGWEKLAARYPNAVLLVWLPPEELAGVEALLRGKRPPSSLFFSATLLKGDYRALPDAVRELSFLSYPGRLPEDGEYARGVAASWLAFKKIPNDSEGIATRMYFLTRMLARVLLDLGDYYYRDFFLDTFDDGRDQSSTTVPYPLLSFGPGQRYCSKGCYIVTLTKGRSPKVVRQSDWVIY